MSTWIWITGALKTLSKRVALLDAKAYRLTGSQETQ